MTPIVTIGKTPVYRLSPQAICWTGGMAVDGDGSPRCYHPDSAKGLDRLANAGKPGNWWGIATDASGKPFIQGPNDPAPGFYVSTTSLLADSKRAISDPRRYTNSEQIPFIVVPGKFAVPGLLGKRAVVINLANGKTSDAVVADIGPTDSIGEGSIALALALGINPDCRTGGAASGVHYVVFG